MEIGFSKLGTIKLSDWWRGLFVAVATAPLTVIYESVQAGRLSFDWKNVLAVALAGGIGYIIKNLATGQQGQLLTNSATPIIPPIMTDKDKPKPGDPAKKEGV